MKCEQTENLILDSIDGALGASQQAELSGHLAGCAACARFQASQLALDERLLLSLGAVKAPARLRENVLRAVDSAPSPLMDKPARLAEAEALRRAGLKELERFFLAEPRLWLLAAEKGVAVGALALALGLLVNAVVASGFSNWMVRSPYSAGIVAAVVLTGAFLFALARHSPLRGLVRGI